LPKDEAKLTESAGRSGSLFFRTDDKQFFFKTILHPEVGTLCSVLKQYINVRCLVLTYINCCVLLAKKYEPVANDTLFAAPNQISQELHYAIGWFAPSFVWIKPCVGVGIWQRLPTQSKD
jgi:hypothetical protein